MAIDYDSGSGVFDKLGALVKAWQIFETYEAGTLQTKLDNIDGVLETVNEYDDKARIQFNNLSESLKGYFRSWKISALDLVYYILKQELSEAEHFYTDDLTAMLNYLIFCMNRDSENVLQNTVTLTGPSSGSPSPTGSFSVLASKYLPTVQGADSSSQESGAAWANNYKIVCTNNSAPHAEIFSVQGDLIKGGKEHPEWYNAGLAGYTRLISSVGNTLLPNGGFESDDYSGTGFTNWDIDAGVWNTDLGKETSVVYLGSAALKLICTGTDTTITHSFPTDFLKPYTKYLVTVKAKRTASADGTLNVGFTGTTGFFVSKTVSSGLTTSYALNSAFFNTGADPGDITDFKITLTGATNTSEVVYVDEVCLTKVDMFHGIGIAVVGGDTQPAIDDRWTLGVANNYTGKFQTFFARNFGILLPGAGSPSIADALAG